MRTKFIIISVFCLYVLPAVAQNLTMPDDFRNQGPPKFFEELLDFSSGKKDITRVDVFIQLPYSSIQFVKQKGEFISLYSISLSVFDKDKEKLIAEKSWNSKIELKDFNETVSKKNYTLNMKSFFLKPGKYFMRSSVYDKESNNEMPQEKEFEVRDLSGRVALSDIMLLNKLQEESGKNKISPNVSHNVANMDKGLPVFYELYSDSHRNVSLLYRIKGEKGETVFTDTVKRNIDTGKTQIFYTLKDSSFSMGYYKLQINVLDSAENELASVSKSFFSRWIGFPVSITDLDKAVDEMIYIASPSQISKIKNGKTKKEKLELFKAFWKKQDPTPGTEENEVFDEYYARVAYANAHFSQYFPGWRSDMGMVFILLGPPDNIDKHPFDINAKPYEVWSYYNLNRSFIFVDETGFGDYRLITPLTGDLYRFRR